MAKKLCLLRGINVGGKNIIKMADLRDCLLREGVEEVKTYIQSGNFIFSSKSSQATLEKRFSNLFLKRFNYSEPLKVFSLAKFKSIVESAPEGFGEKPDLYSYDVIFMVKDLKVKSLAKVISLREGVDTMSIGKEAIYFRRLKSRASQSHLSKLVAKPEYKFVTVRNWNTTLKLKELLSEK